MKKRVLLVSSGGGHWIQMQRLLPAFEKCDLYFATVDLGYRTNIKQDHFFLITDSSQWTKLKMLKTVYDAIRIIIKINPQIVISTGAAPGMWTIIIGKLTGARTIWLDSIANAEKLSLSGRLVSCFADLYLTQWKSIANKSNATYAGAVV